VQVLRALQALNEEIARRVTLVISTMWCTYAFALFVLVPFVVPSAEMLVMYISSSFLQLVFLPLILVGQGVLQRESERRAKQDHEAILQELQELQDIHKLLLKNTGA